MYFESEVRPEQDGRLLLDSLVERFTYHSREEWVDRFARGLVSLNGAVADASTIAHKGDKVVYHVENYEEPEVPTDFDTVFEDDEFLLVAKPAGIPVHHTGRIFYNTFTAVVRRATDCETAVPMHRLDRDTGGLMLFAKYAETAARFQKNLDRILLRKFYLAVVRGSFPHEEYRCDLPLREDPQSAIRLKMFHFEDGKPCSTIFRPAKRTRSVRTLPNSGSPSWETGFTGATASITRKWRMEPFRKRISAFLAPIATCSMRTRLNSSCPIGTARARLSVRISPPR